MENPKSDEKNEPTAPPAENKDGGPTASPTVTVLMQAPPSQLPLVQPGAQQEGYSRSCNANNPCCCSHIQTSAKIFAGIYGGVILLSALIFIWLIIDPASLLGYTGCHIVGAASEGNIEECKEVAREYFAGPIGVFWRIYGVLGFIFYAGTGIGTMIVLCVETPGGCCVSISAQITFIIVGILNTGSISLATGVLGFGFLPYCCLVPVYLVWVLFCYRTFLQHRKQAPTAFAFAPNNALPQPNPSQHSQYPPPPQYSQYPLPPQYSQYPPPPQYSQYPPLPQHPQQPPPPTQPYQP